MSAKRIPLAVALLLTPDSRPGTRTAIMRVAILNERSGFVTLSSARRKRLMRGKGKAQRAWVSVGISLYGIARTRPLVLPLFFASLIYLASSAAARLI